MHPRRTSPGGESPATAGQACSHGVLVDTHVHIYGTFSLRLLLESAVENFASVAERLKLDEYVGVLLLTSTAREPSLSVLSGRLEAAAWTWRPLPGCPPTRAVCASGPNGRLLLLAGSQVVTSERLEVLALLTDGQIPDGLSTEDTIEAVIRADGVPVLPWAAGKWLGHRSKIVRAALLRHHEVLPADNGGRPALWPLPDIAPAGRAWLSGTDPLPIAGEESRVGSAGILIRGRPDLSDPAAGLRAAMLDRSNPPVGYGRPQNLLQFLINQTRLRL